ncbi:MAG: hypothetical protein QOG16_494 [Actinomycetota bacterium]|nr:hypothetical protein [Actinomycetota bacterium]
MTRSDHPVASLERMGQKGPLWAIGIESVQGYLPLTDRTSVRPRVQRRACGTRSDRSGLACGGTLCQV